MRRYTVRVVDLDRETGRVVTRSAGLPGTFEWDVDDAYLPATLERAVALADALKAGVEVRPYEYDEKYRGVDAYLDGVFARGEHP